ncbi:MAG: AAA family ATPase [Gammaproteobacteria bacterium]|nr:AAA family ATPase [Gammaproteobacteria bacterium]
MSITALSIRNFRSIVSLNETVLDLNIFVGQNDEGKSNILRALDLFFNHDKRDGYKLDWNRDYCCFAPKRSSKAKEITITIEITPPPSFANRGPAVWIKTWRRDGLHHDSFKHKDGTEVSPKSKIAAYLKAMRFDYVPAIKGRDYFQVLMSKLHDMLETSVEEQVRTRPVRSLLLSIRIPNKYLLKSNNG